jgi:hypothetical protein
VGDEKKISAMDLSPAIVTFDQPAVSVSGRGTMLDPDPLEEFNSFWQAANKQAAIKKYNMDILLPTIV